MDSKKYKLNDRNKALNFIKEILSIDDFEYTKISKENDDVVLEKAIEAIQVFDFLMSIRNRKRFYFACGVSPIYNREKNRR